MNKYKNSLLASYVFIRQAAIRSIRLENDLQLKGIVPSYVITSQTLLTLGRILHGLDGAHVARAWTLTGPYGSGKSYFGLFLMNLLSKNQPEHSAALSELVQFDDVLAREVQEKQLDSGLGFFPIPITGYRASLLECLHEGLARAVQQLAEQGIVTEDLAALTTEPATSSRAFVAALSTLLEHVTEHSYRGVLLIIDELGKPLEYAATNPEATDIYLLQEIAELANRSGDKPLVVIGVFHQAFERYAAFLDNLTQQEWSKVQGRFEDVPFMEPPTQQAHLVARAIEHEDELLETIEPLLREHLQRAVEAQWCPPTMAEDEFADLALRTYPLHPTTLVALPLVFRRLAQNERSLFAYLTSQEPKGFQEFLQQNQVSAFICLSDLFDYVAANFQGRLYASGRGRILAEVLDRLNGTSSVTSLESSLLKSIGLLNWLGETSHLHPTEDALIAALSGEGYGDEEVRQGLLVLQQRSTIVYRRFNRSYAIWQGSDVDIEDRLHQAHQHLTRAFSPAEMIQRYLPARPLVARRHSYRIGTTRSFDVRYADRHTDRDAVLADSQKAHGLVILCLPMTASDEHSFAEWVQDLAFHERPGIVIGIARPSLRLIELLYELHALQWVYEHTPELRDDVVARREWRTRVDLVERLVQQHLDVAFGPHQLTNVTACRWYYRGVEVTHEMGRNLTVFLSTVCDEMFYASPRVWNELLNRWVLSSQASAARRNLIEAMLTHSDQSMLGIEGYPPERSMYESLLRAGGLHQEDATGHWRFGPPPPEDPLGLQPVWNAIAEYVFALPVEMRSVEELFRRLNQPPYGVTDGVLPVLLCAFYLVYQDQMTLYREGTLLPEPSIADWEVLLRRPDLFSMAGCQLVGPRYAIVERLASNLGVTVAVMPVVRELLRRLKALPEHTWRTQRLPEPALRVRQAVERARSPEQLLFKDLPEALGLSAFGDQDIDPVHVTEFFDQLNDALQVLNEVTPQLRSWARDELLAACKLPMGDPGWDQFLSLAEEMMNLTTHPKLVPMLQRAAMAPNPQAALDSVLAFVASRPLRTWTDTDADRFPVQARTIGTLFVTERENLVGDIPLTPEQQRRSRQLAEDLQNFLQQHYNEDSRVIWAALRLLLRGK